MSVYKPDIKIYYGSIDPDNRLIPAPDLSISVEYNYSNDSVIGYSYIFNLSGYATALDLRELEYGEEYNDPDNYNIGSVVDHMHKLRAILSQNGSILRVVDGQTDSVILEARGGILRSLTFEPSPNNWTNYASYTASLEFHSVDFMSSTENCDEVFLDPLFFPNASAGIVDINSFKIKSFTDSWSFTFNENDAYNRAKQIETGTNIDLNNLSFNIEYTINAVGKNFHVYEQDSSQLLPAWEQAKNFVQYRLYEQVTNLLDNVLKNPYSPCTSSDTLANINIPGSQGLLSSLGDASYKIYNEEITCDVSESAGSFSATYSAIVSSTNGNALWSADSATHSVDKSVRTNIDNNGKKTKVISINGTIQGLIEGGLIRTNSFIELPNKGSITLLNNISDNKYNNALTVLNKIYNDQDYNQGFGNCGKRDLKPGFKNALGINLQALQTTSQPIDPNQNSSCDTDDCVTPDPPHPLSFNLTHNYNNGTITYSAEYSSSNANCVNGGNANFTQITIQTTNPSKVYATFNIPNSLSGPVIQELGTYSNKTVSVSITGTDASCKGKPKTVDFNTLISCEDDYLPIKLPTNGNYILTQKQYTHNPIDGSFSINLGYICNTTGCVLPVWVGG